MQQTASQQPPKCKREAAHPTRYIVRVETPEGIKDVAMGTDLSEMLGRARRQHAIDGLKTWVWNVRTGQTVLRIERGESAGGCQ